ncbi:MAG: AAC(3) family N-acetyltransferase [Lachnospiraceae bacterium]|nr:AAC(3) family N-acetyltransferase [Lachnospiraceae bacterium]
MEIEQYLDSLIKEFESLGVKRADILYISSDVTLLTLDACRKCGLKGKKGIDTFYGRLIDRMQEMVSGEGTLLFPVFTWSFCRNIPYDEKTTQGEVGALGNWVLNNRADFVRTGHPLYSFMVWGRDREKLAGMKNRTAWGKDSPFAWLHENHAKNLIINVSLSGSFTFLHYVEESIHVPHRYYKDFHGQYLDAAGHAQERTYTMFVRDLAIESRQVTPDDCLVEAHAACKGSFGNIGLQLVDFAAAYPVIEDNLRYHNGDQWYDFMGYRLDWEAGQTHPDETTLFEEQRD